MESSPPQTSSVASPRPTEPLWPVEIAQAGGTLLVGVADHKIAKIRTPLSAGDKAVWKKGTWMKATPSTNSNVFMVVVTFGKLVTWEKQQYIGTGFWAEGKAWTAVHTVLPNEGLKFNSVIFGVPVTNTAEALTSRNAWVFDEDDLEKKLDKYAQATKDAVNTHPFLTADCDRFSQEQWFDASTAKGFMGFSKFQGTGDAEFVTLLDTKPADIVTLPHLPIVLEDGTEVGQQARKGFSINRSALWDAKEVDTCRGAKVYKKKVIVFGYKCSSQSTNEELRSRYKDTDTGKAMDVEKIKALFTDVFGDKDLVQLQCLGSLYFKVGSHIGTLEASTEEGFSGGPIVDPNGNLMGTVLGGMKLENRNLVLLITHPRFEQLLKEG